MSVLQRPTLVLNRNWQAIHVTTVSRAMILVWNESARIVDPVDYQLYDWEDWSRRSIGSDQPFVRGGSVRLPAPEVIALSEFTGVPASNVTFSRRNIFKRDRFTCQYCGRQPRRDELTLDHVVPRAQRGESSWDNCVLACIDCNSRKADRTPEKAGMKLRRRPVRPNWSPLYAARNRRIESWSKFVSEAYWNFELES